MEMSLGNLVVLIQLPTKLDLTQGHFIVESPHEPKLIRNRHKKYLKL